ncbi:MAG: DUF1178 family protein [Pararhodobacter sp.]|nr:DUF1178 family protein [Pararhodobacter sp.]
MIRYSLKCDKGHDFDSWFASSAAFDRLHAAGHVSCAICGSAGVDKALMAPSVSSNEALAKDADPGGSAAAGPLAAPAPQDALASRLAALRRHVEANSDYVGMEFVREARAIHAGEAPERAIWGEAKLDEAKALAEDGVPVAPLPFGPRRNAN